MNAKKMILETMLTTQLHIFVVLSLLWYIPTVISELHDILTKVFDWFANNHMKANPDKCHLLVSTKNLEVVSIDVIQTTSSTSENLLGITADSELNFENH